MASFSPSPFSLNLISPTSATTSRYPFSLSLYFLSHTHSSRFKFYCINQTIQFETQQICPKKKQRKPRPSFSDQVLEKWSRKPTSLREKFPWQKQESQQERRNSINLEKEDEERERSLTESRIDGNSVVSKPVSFDSVKSIKLAPWVQETKPRKQSVDFDDGKSPKDHVIGQIDDGVVLPKSRIGNKSLVSDSVSFDYAEDKNSQEDGDRGQIDNGVVLSKSRIGNKSLLSDSLSFDYSEVKNSQKDSDRGQIDDGVVLPKSRIGNKSLVSDSVNFDFFEDKNSQKDGDRGKIDDGYGKSEGDFVNDDEIQTGFVEEEEDLQVKMDERGSTIDDESQSVEKLPWEENVGGGDVFKNRSNTPLAEKLIPEFELRRLRNKARRMAERFRVGAAAITQELVDSIHEKWKRDEVVKLKFKGPSAMNMKRTHESLESRTDGLVIWRSGSSVVLFRGMTYKLPCVQSFTKHKTNDIENNSFQRTEPNEATGSWGSSMNYARQYIKDLSEEELQDLKELNRLLDDLGPRFRDWSGREPLPVDADLLPSVVEGYKRPFRLLPYGVKPGLRDKETTFFRRTARTMPPHFALGRNRELQGLAVAMVKLWERSAIAKIAIKRGVHNTCNERMAEELKRLTGGTLLSRNKDYIVFYRGNDFLPPNVTKTLTEAQVLRTIQQEEEDKARQKASTLVESTPKHAVNGPLVAGTLEETMAATSRWGSQPTSDEIEKMRRDSALARHASLVRFLEKKLALAKGKMKKAEKALAKVQEYLDPSELPTDLETLTDEERFSLRKIGLSMKPYLVLGRRGIFDGTIENMHLHWKYRELVKIMVERKSFAQVKHVAISLEAESGGVLVSVDKTTKGYAIIVYRGKNYQRPKSMRPRNLLTRRQALARSIELQRREALKHHMLELQERIQNLKSELEDMKIIDEIDEETLHARVEYDSDSDPDSGSDSDSDSDEHDEMTQDEDEEAYLEIYEDGDEIYLENQDE